MKDIMIGVGFVFKVAVLAVLVFVFWRVCVDNVFGVAIFDTMRVFAVRVVGLVFGVSV